MLFGVSSRKLLLLPVFKRRGQLRDRANSRALKRGSKGVLDKSELARTETVMMENLSFVSDPDLIQRELLGSFVLALDCGALTEE